MKTYEQFISWINEASPDDLLSIGRLLSERIGTLDQTHRDRFVKEFEKFTLTRV